MYSIGAGGPGSWPVHSEGVTPSLKQRIVSCAGRFLEECGGRIKTARDSIRDAVLSFGRIAEAPWAGQGGSISSTLYMMWYHLAKSEVIGNLIRLEEAEHDIARLVQGMDGELQRQEASYYLEMGAAIQKRLDRLFLAAERPEEQEELRKIAADYEQIKERLIFPLGHAYDESMQRRYGVA